MKIKITDDRKTNDISELNQEFDLGIEDGGIFAKLDIDIKAGEPRLVKKGKKVTITYTKRPQVYKMLLKVLSNVDEDFDYALEYSGELGVMYDCSRNAVPTIDSLKKSIRNMAIMGYTYLQLYTEDTYEVEGEPLFGYKRGAFTADEVREVVEYADVFGMEVIPCVQTLAHLNSIFRYKEYKSINDIDDILLAEEERTHTLIENMFKTLRATYKTNRIHLGMDEAHALGRGKYFDKHGAVPFRDIFARHLSYVLDLCNQYGFTNPVIWSDMYFRMENGGEYYIGDKKFDFTDEVKSKVPNNVTITYWDYYHVDDDIIENMLRLHKSLTPNVAYAGGLWKWAGYAPFNNISEVVDKHILPRCKKYDVNDILMTAWGDCGAECSMFAVLPSMLFASEMLYEGNTREINGRCLRLFGYTYRDMCKLDLLNVLTDKFSHTMDCTNPSKYLLYNDPIVGLMDPYMPEDVTERYEKITKQLYKHVGAESKYEYLFDVLWSLGKLLTVKASLSRDLRRDYLVGGSLDEYPKRIKMCRKYLKIFREKYREQWYKENKPFGYEVLDMRLSALDGRLDTLEYRLDEYISGKITTIPEFDAKVEEILGEGGKTTVLNDYALITSSCSLR